MLARDGEREVVLCWGAAGGESDVVLARNVESDTPDVTWIADFSPAGEIRDAWPPARRGDGEVERSEPDSAPFGAIKAAIVEFGAEFELRFLEATFSEAVPWGQVVRVRFLDEDDDVRLVIGWLRPGAEEFEIAYAPAMTDDGLGPGPGLEFDFLTGGSVFFGRVPLGQAAENADPPHEA